MNKLFNWLFKSKVQPRKESETKTPHSERIVIDEQAIFATEEKMVEEEYETETALPFDHYISKVFAENIKHELLPKAIISIESNVVKIDPYNISISCHLIDYVDYRHGKMFCLGFRITMPDGNEILEQMALAKLDAQSAVLEASRVFHGLLFDLLIKSYSGYHDSNFEIIVNNSKWHLSYSALGTVGFDDNEVDETQNPKLLLSVIKGFLSTSEANFHYMKIYLSKMDETYSNECRFDNIISEEATQYLFEEDVMKWGIRPSLTYKKQFIMLRKCA